MSMRSRAQAAPDLEFSYCPYCGEQDLFPVRDREWDCRACLRTFIVTLTAFGLASRGLRDQGRRDGG